MSCTPYDRLMLFQGLSSEQIDVLRPLFVIQDMPAGTLIFEQGEPAEYLYLLVEGAINIRYKPDDGPEIIVARIRPDGIAGWSAALGSPGYTSSAICTEECQMLRVRGQDLRSFCEQHPETGTIVLERLAAVIAQRLQNTHRTVIELLEQGLHIKISEKPVAAT